MGIGSLGKALVIFGVVLILVGAWIQWGPRLPWIGRLPGDIFIKRDGFQIYFPVVTCLVVSVVATLVLNLLHRK